MKNDTDVIEPQRPNTIARSLAIGNPADGIYASRVIRVDGRMGGGCVRCRDRFRYSGTGRDGRHLYRNGGRRDHCCDGAAVCARPHSAGRTDRHLHYRQRAQDDRLPAPGPTSRAKPFVPRLADFENFVEEHIASRQESEPGWERVMSVRVLLPNAFQKHTNNVREISSTAANLPELVTDIEGRFPALRQHLSAEKTGRFGASSTSM